MSGLRFGLFGAGFWARFQLAAWQELEGVRCVAVCDPILDRAEALARERGVSGVHTDPAELLRSEALDFCDVVTPVETHEAMVKLAAAHRVPVICQKPMATSLAAAEQMVDTCHAAGIPFFVHENWRWQAPMRGLKRALSEGQVGKPFRARIEMISGFPVFRNQPSLKQLQQFIVADMGSHLLDAARFLFGEAQSLYCQTQRVHPDIQGEDVATVTMQMGEATVICAMGFAENYLERDRFPETFAFIEADHGSVELAPDFWIRVTTSDGTNAVRCAPTHYSWADPVYEVAQSSMVACHANLLAGLRGEGRAETTGEDNLKTVRLIFAAYKSARRGEVVHMSAG